MSSDRALSTGDELRPLLAPRSLAVIGASSDPRSYGSRIVQNVLDAAFPDPLHIVHPRESELFGRPCFASVGEIGTAVDCALVAVSAANALPVVEECAEAGVRSVIVYASGFAELGTAAGRQSQDRLASVAAESGMRICGPNSLGIFDFSRSLALSFVAPAEGDSVGTTGGRVSVVSQSGGIGFWLCEARYEGMPIGRYASPGNACDVDVLDVANALLDDEGTGVVAVVLEGVEGRERLEQLGARSLSSGKPVVAFKMGRSDRGRQAAISHTGTVSGTAELYDAAFSHCGLVPVTTLEDVVEVAQFFAKAAGRRSTTGGVGVLSASGGAAVLCCDAAQSFDVPLPPLSATVRDELSRSVPSFAVLENPVDVTGNILRSETSYEDLVRTFASDPAFDAVLLPVGTHFGGQPDARSESICTAAAGADAAMVAWWTSSLHGSACYARLAADERVSVFRDLGRCFKAVKLWSEWHARRGSPSTSPTSRLPDSAHSSTVRSVLAEHDTGRPRFALDEWHSRRLGEAAGMAFVPARVAGGPSDVAAAARAVGFPVALKVLSSDLPHKARHGGVRLGIAREAGIEQVATGLLHDVARSAPSARIDGLLVAAMAPPGAEMMVGGLADTEFGPMVTVAVGGWLAEVSGDARTALAPLGLEEARTLIAGLRCAGRLPAAARDALADFVVAASLLVCTGAVAEIDVNPIAVGDWGAVGVDALVVIGTERSRRS